MVQGTKWPQGDPFLTKQNEPSIAVSSRNARHLLAGSNDYRLVPVEIAEQLDEPEAWIQVYKSLDGGETWYGAPLGGCPVNIPECTDSTGLTTQLRNLSPNFGADPTARPGPYGTFFLSFIAGQRNNNANGVVAVQRFVDKNNDVQRGTDVRGTDAQGRPFVRPAQDPILPDSTYLVSVGTPGQGVDKPWVVADLPGRRWSLNKRNCTLLGWTQGRQDVGDVSEVVPAFNVYVTFANFTGQGSNQKPQMFVAVSIDCGKTFGNPIKLSAGTQANQGSSSAIDPLTGTVYVVWRNFDTPSAIMMSKSTDGGASWSNQPIRIANFNAYDQGSTNVSMRSLGFPTVAVSVGADGKSRVHVAWAQRKVAPSTSSPYGCPGANADDCDARIVMKTSLDGGNTWPANATPVSDIPAGNDPFNPAVGRGNQIQPSMTFAAGKLLITWLDQRLDSTEGKLVCQDGTITSCEVSAMHEVREPRGNLDPNCKFPAGVAQVGGQNCYLKDTVFTPYISDGTKYLVRRHTLDVFTATALPIDVPAFTTSRASQYTFGTTVQGTIGQDGKLTPVPGTYAIRQKQVNPVNLPLFANGTGAFLGDYIDSAGPIIVATGDPNTPYKFNVGGNANTQFTTGGRASTFHIAFTDNRDVIPPFDGNWVTPACNTSAFTKDASGNITGVSNANSCNGAGKPGPGFSGNRNQNVYTAIASDHSLAFANFNSKLLNSQTFRRFVVTVQNLSNVPRTYQLDTANQASGATAVFDETLLTTTATVTVQPGSTATRIVSAKSGNPKAQVVVKVTTSSDLSWTTQVVLNADPTGVFVTNGDPAGTPDTANDNLNNVVLSNAVLTNNALSNNVLSNNVLSNNALTNAVLSNVVLSNNVLSNLTDPNNALSNAVLSNVVLSNVVLTNQSLGNVVLSNAVLSNVVLTNNALNVALSNLDPTNVALSNVVLSNNALTNVVLSNADPNNALSNAVLSNNVLSNAVLSNVVLSNVALSNNVLSNNVLSNVVLSNASIPDQQTNAQTTGNPDADPLRAIETGSPELTANSFTSTDLGESGADNLGFKDTTFTVRNRGNSDTMLSVKMLLRDAVGCTGAPPYTSCQPPPTFKLQVILRKVAFNPAAIPPTNPAVSSGQTYQLGLLQRNAEVSNVGTLALIDPADPNFGKFQPLDANAATLPLAAGEWAYVTIRAIGVNGTTPPDPADLLQWGAKAISSNATTTSAPLIITTQSLPPSSIALTPASPQVATFGGTTTPQIPISGTAQCTDKNGNPVLNGAGAPAAGLGSPGNWYVDTANNRVYGPKDIITGWGSGQPQIDSAARQGDPQPGPHAILPFCPLPPNGTALTLDAFATNAISQISTSNVHFTSQYWGDFYVKLSVFDSTSVPDSNNNLIPEDRQVIKVTVQPRPPVVTYDNTFPTTLTFQETPFVYRLDLKALIHSDSKNSVGVAQPIVLGTTTPGVCTIDTDGKTLLINAASPPSCAVTVHQDGNETYAPYNNTQFISIAKATQNIAFTKPADNFFQYQTGNAPTTLVATVTSPTAPVIYPATFMSSTPGVCTTTGLNGSTLSLTGAGPCTITVSVQGDANYIPATTGPLTFQVAKADQFLTFTQPATMWFGNQPQSLVTTITSPTATPLPVQFAVDPSTPGCTVSGGAANIVHAGTCTITASQPGDANHNPSTPPTIQRSFTINQADQIVTFTTATPSGVIFGDAPINVAATHSTAPPPSGTAAPMSGYAVTFSTAPASVCTNVGGQVTIAGAGTCTVTASVQGDQDYNPANAQQVFNVAKAPTQITPTTLQFFAPFGSTAVLSGNVNRTGVPSVFPSDNVSIDVQKNGVSVKTFSPLIGAPNGAFTVTDGAPLLAPDSYSVIFTYVGNSNFTAAGPVNAALRVEGFSNTGAMSTPRAGHTATLLADGNVLVAGGAFDLTGAPTNTAEFYCAVVSPRCSAADIGTFKSTGSLANARFGHTATRLPDGNVLIAGGATDASGTPTAIAELYCASVAGPLCLTGADVGTFKTIATSMTTARVGHTATLLNDTTVLIVGGLIDNSGPPTTSSELYCTAAAGTFCTAADVGKFKAGASLAIARDSHTATLLQDFTVLVAGGDTDGTGVATKTAEIYCPAVGGVCTAVDVGTFKAVTSQMSVVRSVHAASLLSDGRVLIEGGDDNAGSPQASADVYCATVAGTCGAPDVGTFKAVAGGLVTGARSDHVSTVLTNGKALVLGGRDVTTAPLSSSELFSPAVTSFSAGAFMGTARSLPTATLLGDGRVLVTGGRQASGNPPLGTAEIYNGPF